MQLIINGRIVDFQLDNEQYLGQIVPVILYSLKTQGLYHISMTIDGQSLDLSDSSWHDHPLDTIKEINVGSATVLELDQCLSTIKTLLSFISEKVILDPSLMIHWDDIVESIGFWLIDYKLNHSYFDALKDLSIEKIETQIDQAVIIKLLSRCLSMLEEKDRELLNPTEELEVAISLLQGYKESLESISTLFLRGADHQAIESMVPFIESIEKLRRCSFFLDDNHSSMKKQSEDFMKEIDHQILIFSEACEKKDYILAGDIAEYEIAERLILLDDLLSSITLRKE